ncbi:MAG: Lacal_2735 family protein [Flavobacteriales bacterium]|nr:Lacal_2735 family protein [Flavobacteriales bacterium]
MNNWFIHKEKIQILQDQYIRLMRKSYELALRDKEKSDKTHEEACRIKNELIRMR